MASRGNIRSEPVDLRMTPSAKRTLQRAAAASKKPLSEFLLGARAILAPAIPPDANASYEKHGFRPSPVEPMTLMVTIEEAGGDP